MGRPLDQDLAPSLAGLAFLLGTWKGEGIGEYPTLEGQFRYSQELVITPVPGKDVLSHSSRSWNAETGARYAGECGWWRAGVDPGEVELVLAHSLGVLERYFGQIGESRAEVATSAVVCTPTAKPVTGARRLYGRIGVDLGYVVELAAVGQELTPHLSARLERA
jgi:hypothetical protein